MGLCLSWLAIKGKSPQAVREELGFQSTGEEGSFPEFPLSAVVTAQGWYVIAAYREERVVPDSILQQLASPGCELVTCFLEEHVMVSEAAGWKDGKKVWSVSHDAQKSIKNLVATGDLPEEFAAIRDRLVSQQDEEDADEPGCDYIFDVPLETAKSVTGFSHDVDNGVFEVLSASASKSSKPSFWKKLFGS